MLAAVLSVALATLSASSAPAQLSGEGPPPPEYQVEGDGSLIIGGDVVVPCSTITNPYATEGATPEQRRAAEEEAARACETAGFGASAPAALASAPADDGPPRTEALPETGGLLLLLGPLALLLGTGMLVRAIAPARS